MKTNLSVLCKYYIMLLFFVKIHFDLKMYYVKTFNSFEIAFIMENKQTSNK